MGGVGGVGWGGYTRRGGIVECACLVCSWVCDTARGDSQVKVRVKSHPPTNTTLTRPLLDSTPPHRPNRLKNTKFLVLDEADEMLFDCRNPEADAERGSTKDSSSNYVMLQVGAWAVCPGGDVSPRRQICVYD